MVNPEDVVIDKGTGRLQNGYSGWEGKSKGGSDLETIITPRSSEEKVRVFIGGLATDYCVKATTLDIAKHFEDDNRVSLYLLRDAIRAVNLDPSDGSAAYEAMLDARAVALSSDEARSLIETETY
jgi:nicotinamidase/pyrazinamidase